MDFRYNTDFTDMNICNIAPSHGDLDISGAQRLVPGNPELSLLLVRMETNDQNDSMPPLARLTEDTAATTLFRDWISSLSTCN